MPVARRAPARALWALPAAYLLFVAAEFAVMTDRVLALTAAGASALTVGALGTALWTGILLAAWAAHHAVQRVGSARVLIGGVALALVATGVLGTGAGLPRWLAAAGALGLGGGLVWVAGEAWLAEEAPPQRRGLLVGAFETSVGVGMMVGPALVPLARRLDWPLPLLCVALMAAALAAVASLARQAPAAGHAGPERETASAPAPWPLFGVAALGGVLESGVSALLPSVAMRTGFGADAAALLGAVIGAGSALLQPPAGHLADRHGTWRTLLGAWAAVAVTTLALAWRSADAGLLLWVAGFVLGGAGGAVYTLAVIELGHRLRGALLVRAIGSLVIAYAAGTALGPVVGGALFDAQGLRGLALALAALAVAGGAWTAGRLRSPG
jgi:MFS family permease